MWRALDMYRALDALWTHIALWMCITLWMMFADCVYKLFQTQVHGRGRAVALCIALWPCIELWMMCADCVYELFQTQVHDVGGWGAHWREVSTVCVSPVWVGPLLAQTVFMNCFKLQKLTGLERFCAPISTRPRNTERFSLWPFLLRTFDGQQLVVPAVAHLRSK